MKVKENLETKEQLRLVGGCVVLILTIASTQKV